MQCILCTLWDSKVTATLNDTWYFLHISHKVTLNCSALSHIHIVHHFGQNSVSHRIVPDLSSKSSLKRSECYIIMLYTQNDLFLEALASGRRISFKKRANKRARTVGFRQQLFANHTMSKLFQYFTIVVLSTFLPHNPNTSLFGFLFVFRLLHCAWEELELVLWLWNYNLVLVF